MILRVHMNKERCSECNFPGIILHAANVFICGRLEWFQLFSPQNQVAFRQCCLMYISWIAPLGGLETQAVSPRPTTILLAEDSPPSTLDMHPDMFGFPHRRFNIRGAEECLNPLNNKPCTLLVYAGAFSPGTEPAGMGQSGICRGSHGNLGRK